MHGPVSVSFLLRRILSLGPMYLLVLAPLISHTAKKHFEGRSADLNTESAGGKLCARSTGRQLDNYTRDLRFAAPALAESQKSRNVPAAAFSHCVISACRQRAGERLAIELRKSTFRAKRPSASGDLPLGPSRAPMALHSPNHRDDISGASGISPAMALHATLESQVCFVACWCGAMSHCSSDCDMLRCGI